MTKNSVTIYQLSARGNSRNGWRFKMKSKDVFHSREDAEAHKPAFIEVCCDEKHFECAYPEGLQIEIIELELH